MNCVFSSDDNFADILGCALISLFENNREQETIEVYILDGGISEGNKRKLESIFQQYERMVHFIEVPDISQLTGEAATSGRWPISAFARIFVDELIPKTVKQILYLDCDVLVLGSLKNLWEMDLKDKTVAGTMDCLSRQRKQNIGIANEDPYINSGVMLIDMDKWRINQIEKRCMDYIRKSVGKFSYPDQDVINKVLHKDLLVLPPEYNAMTLFFDFTYPDMIKYRKPQSYYSAQQVDHARKHPRIVHFTSSFLSLRPWVKGSEHPYAPLWRNYYKRSPWRAKDLRSDNRSSYRKIYEKFYRLMPLPFSVSLSGFLHSVLVPMVHMRKNQSGE